MAPLTAVVVGCGSRGRGYASYAHIFPKQLSVIAAADPRPSARAYMQRSFQISPENLFDDWEKLLHAGKGRIADIAVIATQDQLHCAPCLAAKKLGYHILLEKPMSVSPLECAQIVHTKSPRPDQLLVVCHVLRYLPAVLKIKEMIDGGVLGDIINIQHLEPVGRIHFAHSYVRGNWRNQAESTFSLLAKCCHDVDLLCFWMPSKCKSVSSFGDLTHFNSSKKPPGASSRCSTCAVEQDCVYSAYKAYIDPGLFNSHAVYDPEDMEDYQTHRKKLQEALETGPYGRCVYDSDNDVCDNQVVNFQFESGATASLSMVACTQLLCVRQTRFFGSLGELTWTGLSDGPDALEHYDFRNFTRRKVDSKSAAVTGGLDLGRLSGHGGADFHLIHTFMEAVRTGEVSSLQADLVDGTLFSHLVTFAAEHARLTKSVVSVDDYINQVLEDFKKL